MKRKTRRLLMVAAFIIFLGASYLSLLYAQGYKYSFIEGAFVRTGAIATKADRSATLYVDGKERGGTSFLSNAVSESRLLPGRYDIRLEAVGVAAWHKSATVQEGLVTDFPRVVLVPLTGSDHESFLAGASASFSSARTMADATPAIPLSVSQGDFVLTGKVLRRGTDSTGTPVAENVLGFMVSPDGSRVMWWTRNELWVMWTRDTDYQPLKKNGDTELITRFGLSITRAAWYPDSDHVVVDLSGSLKLTEIDTRGGLNIVPLN